MELVDCHTHTAFSGHGSGTVAEVVGRARELGLATLALTEHLWLPEWLDPEHGDSMTKGQTELYLSQLHEQRAMLEEQHAPLELVIGIEADWLDGRAEELASLCAPYEYVLGSVHFVDGLAVDYAKDVGAWPELGVDETWRRYFEKWLDMAKSPAPFSAFAHPDLPKKYGLCPSFDTREYFAEMAHVTAQRGCMIEVNTSGQRKDVGEAYPSLAVLRQFFAAGVECTVGSDAHAPADIAAGVEDACALIRAAGYRYVTVPTRDGDRRHIRLEG